MKKLAYIELDTHAEIVENFIALMHGSADFDVDYFFSLKIADSLKNLPKHATICRPKELLKCLADKPFDLIIIGTAHRNFNVLNEVCKRFTTAVIVHNQNFRLTAAWQLFLNIFKKDRIYRLKLLLREGLFRAPNLYKNAKHCLVLDPAIAQKDDVFLPLFFHLQDNLTPNKFPKIVVPGAVSQQRRDYRHIFRAVLNFKNPFEIVLLGKASGEMLAEIIEIEKQLPKHLKVTYFDKKIPQESFQAALQSADLLWCPLRTRTEFFSIAEFYGKTKMSGNMGDAIFAGKYAVFPKNSCPNLNFTVSEEPDLEAQFLYLLSKNPPNLTEKFGIAVVQRNLTETLHNIS